jgi:hypothetical protein
MKEKRAPSRSLSLWFYAGLVIAVLLSCGLVGWFGLFNPFTPRVNFFESGIYWDEANEKLSFFTFGIGAISPAEYYTLDHKDQLTCEWTRGKNGDYGPKGVQWWEDPIHSLTKEQFTSLENRFGEIKGYDVVTENLLALITRYQLPLDDLYSSRLVVIKNGNPDTATIIDAQTLYPTMMCQDGRPYLVLNAIVLLVSVAFAVIGLRKLRYKNLWVTAFVILLVVGFILSYVLSLGDSMMNS